MSYDIGDSVRLSVNFCDAINFAAVDPTGIQLLLKTPDGVESTRSYPSLVLKDSTGNYHFDYAIEQSGRYWYRWQGTGAYPSAVEGYFVVKPSQF
jgi:hypothetical protein